MEVIRTAFRSSCRQMERLIDSHWMKMILPEFGAFSCVIYVHHENLGLIHQPEFACSRSPPLDLRFIPDERQIPHGPRETDPSRLTHSLSSSVIAFNNPIESRVRGVYWKTEILDRNVGSHIRTICTVNCIVHTAILNKISLTS